MISISDFPNANLVAEDSEKLYPDTPMMYDPESTDGYVITAYKFSLKERFRLLFRGGLAVHELTYHESLTKRQLVVCDVRKNIDKVTFKV